MNMIFVFFSYICTDFSDYVNALSANTRRSHTCDSYVDIWREVNPAKRCDDSEYCCGTCGNRYCCRYGPKLDQSTCRMRAPIGRALLEDDQGCFMTR